MNSIANVSRPDVVLVESTARPTPKPARVAFRDVLASGASTLVQGAQTALSKLPGSPISAAAVRGSTAGGVGTTASPLMTPMSSTGTSGALVNTSAEGPGATGLSGGVSLGGTAVPTVSLGATSGAASVGTSGDQTGSIEAAMNQSAQLSIYYLQIQQQEDAQNRSFTAMSNVLKTEHDSAKSAINNVHS